MSVTPWGTRRGGENFGSGFFGSGAQSLRASETSTNPARSVSDGWPVKLVMVSISSRSDGTSSRSTCEKMRVHFHGDFAAEAVGLDEVDGGEEARLAEDVGPRVGNLGLELIQSAAEGEFFECGGAFGEEDQVEGIVGPVGKRDFDGSHAEFLDVLEGGAVDVGGGILFIHCGK